MYIDSQFLVVFAFVVAALFAILIAMVFAAQRELRYRICILEDRNVRDEQVAASTKIELARQDASLIALRLLVDKAVSSPIPAPEKVEAMVE